VLPAGYVPGAARPQAAAEAAARPPAGAAFAGPPRAVAAPFEQQPPQVQQPVARTGVRKDGRPHRPQFAVFQPGAVPPPAPAPLPVEAVASLSSAQSGEEFLTARGAPEKNAGASAGSAEPEPAAFGASGFLTPPPQAQAPVDLRHTPRALAAFGFGRLVLIRGQRVVLMDGARALGGGALELTAWPGPLVVGGSAAASSSAVLDAVRGLGSAGEEAGEDTRMLHRVLSLVVEKGGALALAAADTGDGGAPAALAASILGPSSAAHTPAAAPPPPPREQDSAAAVASIERCMACGDRQGALRVAIAASLHSHALIIAATVGREAYAQAVTSFTEALAPTSPLASLYPALAGDMSGMSRALGVGPAASTQNTTSGVMIDPSSPLAWRPHAAALIANRVLVDPRALVGLGDKLWTLLCSPHAAHSLYVAAGMPLEQWPPAPSGSGPTTRMHAVGFSHGRGASLSRDLPSLLRTEALEFARKSGNAQAAVPAAQLPKLLIALAYADIGAYNTAARYVSSARSGVRDVLGGSYSGPGSGQGGPIPSSVSAHNGAAMIGPFPVAMLIELDALSERLEGSGRVNQGGGTLGKAAAAAVGSALSGLSWLLTAGSSEDKGGNGVPASGAVTPAAARGPQPSASGAHLHLISARSGSVLRQGGQGGQADGGGSSRSLGASSTSTSTFPAAPHAAPEPAFDTPKKQILGGAGAPGAGVESPFATPAALVRPPRGGLLAGFRSIFRRKSTDASASAAGGATPGGPRVAKLDDDGAKAYYDETLKRWVFPGETEEEAAPLAPPPKSAAVPQPTFQAGGVAEGGAGIEGSQVPAGRPGGAKRISRYVAISTAPGIEPSASSSGPSGGARPLATPAPATGAAASRKPRFAVFSPPPPAASQADADVPACTAARESPRPLRPLPEPPQEAPLPVQGWQPQPAGAAAAAEVPAPPAFGADNPDDAAAFFGYDSPPRFAPAAGPKAISLANETSWF